MSASPTPYSRAFSSGLVLVLCAACATYVDEPIAPGMAGLNGGSGGEAMAGAGGTGGSDAGGSGGTGGTGVSAGSDSGGSGGESGSAGGMAGGSAGVGGNASGGAAGTAGAGGVAGASGAGGKATGGSGGSGGSDGNGGSGGSGSVQTCAMRPIPAKSSWKLSASHSQANGFEPIGNAHDGNLTNRWSTGKDQSGDEWLQIDFGVEVQITKLTLVLGSSVNDHPRMYQTRIGNNAVLTGQQPIVSGSGQASTDTIMNFPKQTRGRYVRVSQHGSATALWWSVAEIQAECAD